MKFIVSKTELQNALAIAGRAAGSGNILPAHKNFLFTLQKTKLTISATDGDRFISYYFGVDGDSDFTFQLPVRELTEMIKLIPDQPLTVIIKGITVNFQHSTGKFELPFEESRDYPVIKHDEKYNVDMLSGSLFNAFNRVVFAASQDELRPNLMGVFLEFSKSGLNITAASVPVLSTVHITGEYSKQDVLISQKTISTITGLPVNENVLVSIGTSSINFKPNENTVLTCRTIDEKYPDYRGIIPKSHNKTLSISRTHLLTALNRCRVFSRSIENGDILLVTLEMKGNITLVSENLFNQSNSEKLNGDYKGEFMKIEFNCKNLINALNRFDCETAYLHFNDYKSAIIITETETDYGDTLMLTMPYSK